MLFFRVLLVMYRLQCFTSNKKGKGSPYSITERRVLELILVLGSQPAGDMSHKSGGRLPLLFARPAVTLNPEEGCYQFCCLVNRGTMGGTVCLKPLLDSVATAM